MAGIKFGRLAEASANILIWRLDLGTPPRLALAHALQLDAIRRVRATWSVNEPWTAAFRRGHHVIKNIWTPTMGEQLPCKREIGNIKDRYAVAVLRDHTTVGHVPRKISVACALFLQREGSIHCVVTGKRCFHLPHKHKSPRTAAIALQPRTTPTNSILADFNLAVGW